MNEENVSCVAQMPVVDAEMDRRNDKIVANGKQVTVDINLSYQPQLVDPDDLRDNTFITICGTDLCENEN